MAPFTLGARSAPRGLTLIECLIVMGSLALIIGAVLALEVQTVRMYQFGAATSWSTYDAAGAVERLEEDIQSCYRVVGRYNNRIYLSRPRTREESALGRSIVVHPMQYGDTVCYYLSDEDGTCYTSDGPCLWRWEVSQSGEFVRGPGPLARNIAALEFTYNMLSAPRQASVGSIDLTVRSVRKVGGDTETAEHAAHLTLRNAMFGPVTSESGAYEEEE